MNIYVKVFNLFIKFYNLNRYEVSQSKYLYVNIKFDNLSLIKIIKIFAVFY